MVINKFIKENLKLQGIRFLVFMFMGYVLKFVFESRGGIGVFYAFMLIFALIFMSGILFIIKNVIGYSNKIKSFDAESRKEIEESILNNKGYLNEIFITKNSIVIFKCRFNENELTLINLDDVKDIASYKVKNNEVCINIMADKDYKYITYPQSKEQQDEVNELLRALYQSIKKKDNE